MVPARHRNKCGKRQRLPTCLHPIDGYAKSAMYCLFSLEIYKYDPTRKQTGVTASQTSWYQQRGGSLLLIAPSKRLRESRSRDGALRLHLMLRREGGREGGRQGEERKSEKDFFFFFFTCDKSCSHMGGTRPGWIGWSQWSGRCAGVQQAAAQPGSGRRDSVNGTLSRLWRN